jgi:hypothetical protein
LEGHIGPAGSRDIWLSGPVTDKELGRSITSRDYAYAVERAVHLSHFTRDALHRTSTDTALPSNLQHALAGPQMALDSFF